MCKRRSSTYDEMVILQANLDALKRHDWDGPISPSVGRGARIDKYIEPYHGPHAPGFRRDDPEKQG
jgi:hypothetical protein